MKKSFLLATSLCLLFSSAHAEMKIVYRTNGMQASVRTESIKVLNKEKDIIRAEVVYGSGII